MFLLVEFGGWGELGEVIARAARLVCVGEEIWDVPRPGGEVGVVGVGSWTGVCAFDEVF